MRHCKQLRSKQKSHNLANNYLLCQKLKFSIDFNIHFYVKI